MSRRVEDPAPEPYRWDPPPTLASPALHAPDESGKHGLRHASWLELFYDLVFVTAIGGLSGLFNDGFTLVNLARFTALFVAVWWAWVGHTLYATRFATDDIVDRLLTLAVMLGAVGMAVQIPFVTTGENGFVRASDGFALAYVVTRLPLLALYARAYRGVPDARPLARLYLVGIGAGVALWLVSVLTPPPLRFGLWAAGLVVELLVPWAGHRVLERAPVDASHLPERLGLFTIIVLGESVLAITTGVRAVQWDRESVIAATLVFVVVAAVWWLYFTFLGVAPIGRSLGSGQPYVLAHLPLLLPLAVVGDGLLHLIIEASVVHSQAAAVQLSAGALCFWLLAFLGLQAIALAKVDAAPRTSALVLTAAFVGGLGLVGPDLHPLLFLGLLASAFVALAVAQMSWWRVAPSSGTD